MKISKSHLKQLKISKEYRATKISATSIYLRGWKSHLITIAMFSTVIYLAYKYASVEHAIFAGGVLSGTLLRDFVWRRMLTKFWPVSEAITDWQKVDEIINENET